MGECLDEVDLAWPSSRRLLDECCISDRKARHVSTDKSLRGLAHIHFVPSPCERALIAALMDIKARGYLGVWGNHVWGHCLNGDTERLGFDVVFQALTELGRNFYTAEYATKSQAHTLGDGELFCSAVRETAEIARSISRTGVSIVQVGFDENGRLVRLATTNGEVGEAIREPEDVILEERMKQWAAKFPFAYGIDESTANLFYTTTADLRLSHLPDGPIVIAADAEFQGFPPNLLFVNGDFAGRTRPMAATPSLAWLGRARESRHIGNGKMCAWISTAGDGESQTLPMIAERLQPTFEEFGFVVDNGPVLPTAFAGATLAVVTAHGGVHPEGRFFQVVSDEGGLRITVADLANALRNIGVVVLFVCSGGRADKHPAANTTLGLAKQILDRGCSAVIASPWPLDARVPSHWLPTFLERWTQGATLIEANFRANQNVDRQFAQDPARGLAMTVYGNPEIALTSSAKSG